MRDAIVAALADPYTDGGGVNTPTRMNDVVIDRNVTRVGRLIRAYLPLADSHAAGTKVVQITAAQQAIFTALPKPHRVGRAVANLTILDSDVACAVGHYRRLGDIRRLIWSVTRSGQQFLVVLEDKALQRDMLDEFGVPRLALKDYQFLDYRGDNLCRSGVFIWHRHITERAVTREEPFTRRIECRPEIFQVITRIRRPAGIALELFADRDYRAVAHVNLSQESTGNTPLVIGEESDILYLIRTEVFEQL